MMCICVYFPSFYDRNTVELMGRGMEVNSLRQETTESDLFFMAAIRNVRFFEGEIGMKNIGKMRNQSIQRIGGIQNSIRMTILKAKFGYTSLSLFWRRKWKWYQNDGHKLYCKWTQRTLVKCGIIEFSGMAEFKITSI